MSVFVGNLNRRILLWNFFKLPFVVKVYTTGRTCWKCGAIVSKVFCESCDVLQYPCNDVHYFNLLEVSFSYNINASELVSKYHKLQVILHPDKFTNKSEEEKRISEEYSALINKAFSTLSSPMERGLYMLHLEGKHIEESSMTMQQQLLLEVMEYNEELDECNDENTIHNFSKKIDDKLETLISNISRAFGAKDIETAEKLLTEMKYYNSIKDKIKEKKQLLNIPG